MRPGYKIIVSAAASTALLATLLVPSAALGAERPVVAREQRSQQLTPGEASAAISALSPAQVFPGGLYWDSRTLAAEAVARAKAQNRFSDATLLTEISRRPSAVWLNADTTGAALTGLIGRIIAGARTQKRTAVFVTYAIPNRGCNGSEGLTTDQYLAWNRTIASALRGTGSAVIVEPDSLALLGSADCASVRSSRPALIRQVVDIYAASTITTYLDAGNSNWVPVSTMAALLTSAGVAKTRGFATNVSGFDTFEDERAFANDLSTRLGGKNYVIDTSRNGKGSLGGWCNPVGAALGRIPKVAAGDTKLDALLWVKRPGESDGNCNGGPGAGQWFESYALALVRNR